MRRWWQMAIVTVTGLVLSAVRMEGQQIGSANTICERVLPVAVANRLAARTDLVLIPRRSVPGAGGTCNYAGPGKKMVLLVTVTDYKSHAAEQFVRFKGQAEYHAKQKDVTGVGEAAFTGGAYEHEFVARKGSRVIMLAAMVTMDRATHEMHAAITREQLVALGREVVGRL